jgi:hypothetical protein
MEEGKEGGAEECATRSFAEGTRGVGGPPSSSSLPLPLPLIPNSNFQRRSGAIRSMPTDSFPPLPSSLVGGWTAGSHLEGRRIGRLDDWTPPKGPTTMKKAQGKDGSGKRRKRRKRRKRSHIILFQILKEKIGNYDFKINYLEQHFLVNCKFYKKIINSHPFDREICVKKI